MKKYSLMEHLENLYEWESLKAPGRVMFTQQTAWFTAYERWLNDRDLMTEEDKVPEHVA